MWFSLATILKMAQKITIGMETQLGTFSDVTKISQVY
jgi:hypothetical protein